MSRGLKLKIVAPMPMQPAKLLAVIVNRGGHPSQLLAQFLVFIGVAVFLNPLDLFFQPLFKGCQGLLEQAADEDLPVSGGEPVVGFVVGVRRCQLGGILAAGGF